MPKTSDLGITDAKRDGTGLGLPIVKTIAETHDGWIEVKSSMGEGTTMSPYLALTNKPYGAGKRFEPARRLSKNANLQVKCSNGEWARTSPELCLARLA